MNAVEHTKKINSVTEFCREFRECWERMPDKLLFFCLLVAWLALFHFLGNSTLGYVKTPSLFGWMNFVFTTSADDAHGLLVPFVVLVLFWWKRNELLAVSKAIWWPALGLVALGLVLHMGGYLIQQARVSVVAFFVGLYGLTGLVWGRDWLKASFFPFFLFVFCVPVASMSETVTFPLRLLVTKMAVAVSQMLGIDVIREGSQIFNCEHTFNYDVAPACSGIRSLISLLALTTIYGFVRFRVPWRRGIMVAAAIPLAVIGNVTRITCVILTAEMFGQDAGAWVEQKLGFVTFAVAIGFVILLGHWLRERETDTGLSSETKTA